MFCLDHVLPKLRAGSGPHHHVERQSAQPEGQPLAPARGLQGVPATKGNQALQLNNTVDLKKNLGLFKQGVFRKGNLQTFNKNRDIFLLVLKSKNIVPSE